MISDQATKHRPDASCADDSCVDARVRRCDKTKTPSARVHYSCRQESTADVLKPPANSDNVSSKIRQSQESEGVREKVGGDAEIKFNDCFCTKCPKLLQQCFNSTVKMPLYR